MKANHHSLPVGTIALWYCDQLEIGKRAVRCSMCCNGHTPAGKHAGSTNIWAAAAGVVMAQDRAPVSHANVAAPGYGAPGGRGGRHRPGGRAHAVARWQSRGVQRVQGGWGTGSLVVVQRRRSTPGSAARRSGRQGAPEAACCGPSGRGSALRHNRAAQRGAGRAALRCGARSGGTPWRAPAPPGGGAAA